MKIHARLSRSRWMIAVSPVHKARSSSNVATPGFDHTRDRLRGFVLVVAAHPGLRPPFLVAALGNEVEVVVGGVQQIDAACVRRVRVEDGAVGRRVEVVGPERTALAALVIVRREHEVVDDELAASVEELWERLAPVGTDEDILLLDALPGKLPSPGAQLVAEPRELLLLRQELLTG